jgi:hypothetical protein
MTLADAATRAEVTARLGGLYAGRPVVLGPGVLAGFTPSVAWLRDLGCRCLVLSTSRGAGPVPSAEDCEVVPLPQPPTASMTEELRRHDRLAHDLPADVVAAVEAFDPERAGIFLASPFVTTDEPILGRPVTGGRPAAFLALEDKLLADAVWAAADVAAPPYRIVPVDEDALATATAELAGPDGAVWSGDARDGFNGGGNFVRWVTDERDAAEAHAFFLPRCDRVRVQPFLEGVPCSIHGYVLPDGTAVLRPVEVGVLRDSSEHRFVYSGLGTFWDPPPEDRDQMRAAARRVGEHLRTAHGYRGAFGIDGVLTVDGFRPTELNTRASAGASTVAQVDSRFFALLQHNLVAGRDVGVTAADVESLVPLMDRHRVGKVVAVAEGVPHEGDDSYPLAWDGRCFRRSDEDTGNTFVIGETLNGFFAKVEPCAALQTGQRVAEVTAALLAYVDAEHGGQFGRLTAAPDVRLP